MSGLGFNKVAGAVLATGLAIIGLNEFSSGVYEPVIAKKMGYFVEVKDDSAGAKPEVDLPPDWGTALPAADVKAGQDIFAKCAACHKPTDENNTGPGLLGVVGRAPASHPGFAYSDAMKAFATKQPIWDYDHIYQFIKKPQAYISGTKMTFVGLKAPQDRINVIAYLHTLGSTLPIPKPDPARAAAIAAAASGAAPAAGTAPAAGAAPAAGTAPAAGAAPAGAPAPAAPGAPAGATGPIPSPSGTNTANPAGSPGAPAAAPVSTSAAGPAKK